MSPFKTNPFQRAEEVLMPAAHGTLVWLDGWPEVVLGVQKGLCDSQHGSCRGQLFWAVLLDSSSDDWRRDCVFVCFLIVLLFCVFMYR